MTETMVLAVVTRKEVGGWLEAGRRRTPFLGSVPSKYC